MSCTTLSGSGGPGLSLLIPCLLRNSCSALPIPPPGLTPPRGGVVYPGVAALAPWGAVAAATRPRGAQLPFLGAALPPPYALSSSMPSQTPFSSLAIGEQPPRDGNSPYGQTACIW